MNWSVSEFQFAYLFILKNFLLSLIGPMKNLKNFNNIYIYILSFTDRLFHCITTNSSVWLDMQDASSWDQNLADFMSVRYLTPDLLSFSA